MLGVAMATGGASALALLEPCPIVCLSLEVWRRGFHNGDLVC